MVSPSTSKYVENKLDNNLTYLNLSYKQLNSIPKLDKLQNLKELNLRGNQIRSITDITENLPLKLQKLDIGENLINDLTQIQYFGQFFELEELSIDGNPCVRIEGRAFTYRPFVYSCILSKLKVVDGFVLSEEEILKGEWIHSNAKAKSFRPETNSHLALCEYLAVECPLDPQTGRTQQTEHDVQIFKVLQKRREYLAHSEDDSLSVSLPVRTPTSKNNSNKSYPLPRNLRTPNTNSIRRLEFSTSPKSRNCLKATSSPIKPAKSPIIHPTSDEEAIDIDSPSSDLSSSTVIISRVEELNPDQKIANESTATSLEQPSPIPTRDEIMKNEKPSHESIFEEYGGTRNNFSPVIRRPQLRTTVSDRFNLHAQPTTSNKFDRNVDKEKAATLIQAWWRGSRIRRQFRNPLIKQALVLIRSHSKKLTGLQIQIDKVIDENGRLTTITEQQMSAINTMAEQIKEMQTIINGFKNFQQTLKHLVPTPVSLVYRRDDENNSIFLSWENTVPLLSMVKGYKLFADGENIGEVIAANKRARITDLDLEKEHRIGIQAVSTFGLNSATSEIIVPKIDSEDKENLQNKSILR